MDIIDVNRPYSILGSETRLALRTDSTQDELGSLIDLHNDCCALFVYCFCVVTFGQGRMGRCAELQRQLSCS